MNAMIIDSKDNVAVAIEPIAAGDTVTYLRCLLYTSDAADDV